MSKFIPNKEKKEEAYPGQAKPKLKIKINFQDGETTINEYDLAQMVSNMNLQLMQLSQTVKGITDAMTQITQAQSGTSTVQMATGPMSKDEYLSTGSVGHVSPPSVPTIKLPNLKKVEDTSVKLQS